ncbi:MAG TPA: hypothetical protein VIK93_08190 [Limnochordales bacterium]
MSVFQFDADPGITSTQAAQALLDWVLGYEEFANPQVVQPVRQRSLGGYDAASFVVAFTLRGRRLIMYTTAAVMGAFVYDFQFLTLVELYAEAQRDMEGILQSWRPLR